MRLSRGSDRTAREYKLLSQLVQPEFDREPTLELASAPFHLEEHGDPKPLDLLLAKLVSANIANDLLRPR